ncbi:MAG: hypothetical protein RML35_12050 [Chloroherpetonaceae bacterium]|nr:hypothetical protein [Chloroherpetonaceae bacterium]
MGNDVGVYFTKSWEIEDLPFFPQEDRAWLISYLTAKLKYQLGEIYSSYGAQIPSDAAPFSLNGTELKTEAQTTMEKLETELIQSSQKVLPFFG